MSDDPAIYPCPECGRPMTIAPERANVLVCTACAAETFVPEPEPAVEEEPVPDVRKDDLDGARIRRLATERRSLNRTASYFVVGAGACAVMIAQLAWMTVRHVRGHGWTPRPIGFLIFVVLFAWGGVFALKRAAAFRREARQSTLPDPVTPADFSTLQDGSQRFEGLS